MSGIKKIELKNCLSKDIRSEYLSLSLSQREKVFRQAEAEMNNFCDSWVMQFTRETRENWRKNQKKFINDRSNLISDFIKFRLEKWDTLTEWCYKNLQSGSEIENLQIMLFNLQLFTEVNEGEKSELGTVMFSFYQKAHTSIELTV